MLEHRVIPALLLRDGGLVKTRRFKDAKYIGDPINAIRIFNDKEVDELIVLDIDASRRCSEPDYATIEQIAGECFMPVCYGGGIHSVEQAAGLFNLGIEKICLQSAVFDDPDLISRIADRFGCQSVVVSVDIKHNWLKKPMLYESRKGRKREQDWLEFAQAAVKAGAGEVLLTAVEREGAMTGYDLALVRQAADALKVPLIALGGAGSLADIKAVIDAGASAAAAGSLFVLHGPHRAVLITYPPYAELEKLQEQYR
ncbi:imidazole glycerol phosphate synthase subunit HisF [Pollutimonas nitritireducens]|uniref:imidazole glycerol-phosphate synthase n=1 Tax=Pollutimonas nitritireducens TaxID=2045209 RepID=A0A2N4UDS9_9BURK|nr:AglZ/HisF2 family acetamidino modification protein [Pollutimonas nitritireducens]PLC53169.1 imidazole glycerol phosphate synthase subunit HisF [Pollutimonas nitritireducens]